MQRSGLPQLTCSGIVSYVQHLPPTFTAAFGATASLRLAYRGQDITQRFGRQQPEYPVLVGPIACLWSGAGLSTQVREEVRRSSCNPQCAQGLCINHSPQNVVEFYRRGPTCTEQPELECMQNNWYDLFHVVKDRVVADNKNGQFHNHNAATLQIWRHSRKGRHY